MLPPVHLSPRLPFVARRLADHFEARYAVKLCNLLDDVASLGQSCTTPLTAVNTGKEPIIAYSKDRSEPSSNHGNSASPLPAVGSMCALDEVDAIVPPISSSYPPTQFAVVADANDLYSNSGALSGPVHLNSIYYRPMNRLQVSREHYLRVLCELFQDRVNWGRIIAMLAFLRALCEVTEQRHSSKVYLRFLLINFSYF
ncbi:unnamed protein product [Protopolystoma xenopodis]|uniref:Bcl-2 Bcl-2 homology region 1-3 domain-containing protein n=1 Tax=Protopolystoma xenopodis TaxID=117903 RepID=A0A448XGQ5_9PLAT|nr:unnamed protein product [Protopolystoma xenopodis]